MNTLQLKHLESITGNLQDLIPHESYIIGDQLISVLSETEKIEANKNKLDLKPNIDFVSNHKKEFEAGLEDILKNEPDKNSIAWSEQTSFNGIENIVNPQVSPEECRKILARMPKSLIELSKLETVDYTYSSKIPVPGFDDQGNFDKNQVKLIPVNQFPRENDHNSRILVGYSTGDKIYPTAIPKTVSEDERAIYLYQIHVLLHEFFHTIDLPRRNPEERSKIMLEVDGQQFNFQDWWLAFEELILSKNEPKCVSSYANTYYNDLTQELKETNYNDFTHALAEQICETFVAYLLGIVSNDEGWTNFKAESFGNIGQYAKFIKGESESANLKWMLMDKLCRASIIKQKE